MKTVKVACQAMATRFEILLHGDDTVRLRAAGEEALAEIERVEQQLSAFRSGSIVSRINRRGSEAPVRIPADVFQLLLRTHRLSVISGGAFDVTIGPLLTCWGFRDGEPHVPTNDALGEALDATGSKDISLNRKHRSVRLRKPGMSIDLGGIGKGHALDIAAAVLQDAGVRSALLHGGTSSIRAIGTDPTGGPWRVAIKQPFSEDGEAIGHVALQDESLSVSATSGKYFTNGDKIYGHVIDPRSGAALSGARVAIVCVPMAADADGLSTALLVMGHEGIPELTKHVHGLRTAVLVSDPKTNAWTGVDTQDIWMENGYLS